MQSSSALSSGYGGNLGKFCAYERVNNKSIEEEHIKQDDVFQINCRNLVISDELSFQLVIMKPRESNHIKDDEFASNQGDDIELEPEQLYDVEVLAERKIQA